MHNDSLRCNLVTNGESSKLAAKMCTAGWWGGQGNTVPSFIWTLLFILSTPEVHQKVLGLINANDDQQLHAYLTQCFKEMLRLTTFSVAWRTTKQDTVLTSSRGRSYKIPKDTTVGLHFCINHFNDKIYPKPFEFRPERFDGDIEARPTFNGVKYAWVPFSAGRHKCSGHPLAMKEVPMALGVLFKKLDLQLVNQGNSRSKEGKNSLPGFNFLQAFGVVAMDEHTKIPVQYRLRTTQN